MTHLILAAAMHVDNGIRCGTLAASVSKAAACERADGTLRTFKDRAVDWRVRYFVRYWEMPCGEFPTEQEAYVFHMVTNDLYNDQDLTDADRVEIRNMMFDGPVRCP
jgi:hypothetical protein